MAIERYSPFLGEYRFFCCNLFGILLLYRVKAFENRMKGVLALEDAQIVTLFLERNESAISETAAKYGQRLRSLSFGIVQNRETAEECENDTYYAAWQAIPPHKPESYFYTFLARITRNLSLNRCLELSRIKRKAFICELSNEMAQCIPGNDAIGQYMDREALENALNGFLRELDEQKRNLFIRRYWYLDSMKAISLRFQLSESNVKTILSRCRTKLRERLEKEDIFL